MLVILHLKFSTKAVEVRGGDNKVLFMNGHWNLLLELTLITVMTEVRAYEVLV